MTAIPELNNSYKPSYKEAISNYTATMRYETLTAQLKAMPKIPLSDCTALLDHYGQSRSEVLGYLLSFNEHLGTTGMEDLLPFFMLLVLGYEREGYGRLQPIRATILDASKATKDQVEYLLSGDPTDHSRTAELWLKDSKDQPLLAYAFNEILKQQDMRTEAGIQLYIAVISLIEIFRKAAEETVGGS